MNWMQKLVAIALCAVLLLAGCGVQKPQRTDDTPSADLAQSAAAPLEITDMIGRTVQLQAPIHRVVALTASCCEILFALDAGETLVGRGEYCDYPAQALSAPVLQSGESTNTEQIIQLEPQLVLMGSMAQTQQQIDALSAAGIPVLVSDAQTLEQVYRSIEMIGRAVDRDSQAEALVASMQSDLAALAAKKPATAAPTVYFEVAPLESGLWTAGSGTFMEEIASLIGLENSFHQVEGWAQISEEQVIERDPDLIVSVTMYLGEGPDPREEILARPAWQTMTAVKNGRVYLASSDEITRPGPRLVDAARLLYEYVYESETGA